MLVASWRDAKHDPRFQPHCVRFLVSRSGELLPSIITGPVELQGISYQRPVPTWIGSPPFSIHRLCFVIVAPYRSWTNCMRTLAAIWATVHPHGEAWAS